MLQKNINGNKNMKDTKQINNEKYIMNKINIKMHWLEKINKRSL